MRLQSRGHISPGMIVGIDEAGKGCVVGDLVIGAMFWPNTQPPVEGLKDSKVLSAKSREKLLDALQKAGCAYAVVSIHAKELLPGMVLRAQVIATTMLLKRFRPSRAFIDAPHSVPSKFVTMLDCPEVDIVAEHKADATYPIVSAASIVAKVLRDRRIAAISKCIGREIGSGYPGDERTRSWMADLATADDPSADSILRWSWSTCTEIFGPEKVAKQLVRLGVGDGHKHSRDSRCRHGGKGT